MVIVSTTKPMQANGPHPVRYVAAPLNPTRSAEAAHICAVVGLPVPPSHLRTNGRWHSAPAATATLNSQMWPPGATRSKACRMLIRTTVIAVSPSQPICGRRRPLRFGGALVPVSITAATSAPRARG